MEFTSIPVIVSTSRFLILVPNNLFQPKWLRFLPKRLVIQRMLLVFLFLKFFPLCVCYVPTGRLPIWSPYGTSCYFAVLVNDMKSLRDITILLISCFLLPIWSTYGTLLYYLLVAFCYRYEVPTWHLVILLFLLPIWSPYETFLLCCFCCLYRYEVPTDNLLSCCFCYRYEVPTGHYYITY